MEMVFLYIHVSYSRVHIQIPQAVEQKAETGKIPANDIWFQIKVIGQRPR